MSDFSAPQIAAAGLDHERSRVEMAMLRLSLVDVSFSSSGAAKSFADEIQSGTLSRSASNQITSNFEIKEIFDPNNPNANEQGNVFFLKIDPTKEMATLISATRAYEANARAYNAYGQMTRSALEIGAK